MAEQTPYHDDLIMTKVTVTTKMSLYYQTKSLYVLIWSQLWMMLAPPLEELFQREK